jgi:hypothetical protein
MVHAAGFTLVVSGALGVSTRTHFVFTFHPLVLVGNSKYLRELLSAKIRASARCPPATVAYRLNTIYALQGGRQLIPQIHFPLLYLVFNRSNSSLQSANTCRGIPVLSLHNFAVDIVMPLFPESTIDRCAGVHPNQVASWRCVIFVFFILIFYAIQPKVSRK